MRQTPVNDYLEEISTELPEELYGRLSDAIYETVCEFDEEVAQLKAENAKLWEQIERLQPKDCEGNALDIADTVHMLRSEYDGDHEWDDVVVELALTKWGGDRWIVRGSKGEAWACDCTKTGYDEDAFENSDDVEPFDDATLAEVENAKLRGWMLDALTVITNLECLVHTMQAQKEWTDEEAEFVEGTLSNNEFMTLDDLARELGVEVPE